MTSLSSRCRCSLLVLVLLGAAPSSGADQPDLSEFKTVSTATTTTIQRGTLPETTATQPSYLGIHVEKNPAGRLVVVQIEPESPAAKAGLKIGDVVLEFAGKPVLDVEQLRLHLHASTPNRKTKVAVVRNEKSFTLEVTPVAVSSPLSDTTAPRSNRAVLGIRIDDDKGGVKLTTVDADSAAARAGLKVGDVVVKAAGKTTEDSVAFRAVLADKKPGDEIVLVVRRDGKEQQIKARLSDDSARSGWDTRRTGMFTRDVYRLAVVVVEFPDVKTNPNVTAKDWEKALFSKGTFNDKNATGQKAHGSMNDYYQEISCGRFKVAGKVFAPVAVKNNRETYGATGSNRSALLTESVDRLLDRDGKETLKDFDGIFFLYAGKRAAAQRGGLFWPHRATFRHDGKNWSYYICPEGGDAMSSISVITHEFGHMLGLPDLYARPERPGEEGVGVWCTMSTGHGKDGRPLHFSAWCKEQLGWIQPAVIDPSVKQKLILSPIEKSEKECYKVLVRPDGAEYLLLENRTKMGYDRDLPAEGLLIWRVVNGRPILEESHGITGPTGPARFLGSVPYPSKSNTAFTPWTTPSSKPLSGGGKAVHITNIRKLADGRITFHIGYEYY